MTGFANQQCKYSAFLQNMKKYRNNFTDFPSSDTLSFPVRGKTKRGIRFCGHPSSALVRIPDDPLLGYDADIGTILEQRRHQLELVARIDDHFLQCRIGRFRKVRVRDPILAEIKRREAFDRRKEMVVSPYGRQIAERKRKNRNAKALFVNALAFLKSTRSRDRTGTAITGHRILSPACLPIPPSEQPPFVRKAGQKYELIFYSARKRTVLVRLDAGDSAPDSGDGRGNRKPYHPL